MFNEQSPRTSFKRFILSNSESCLEPAQYFANSLVSRKSGSFSDIKQSEQALQAFIDAAHQQSEVRGVAFLLSVAPDVPLGFYVRALVPIKPKTLEIKALDILAERFQDLKQTIGTNARGAMSFLNTWEKDPALLTGVPENPLIMDTSLIPDTLVLFNRQSLTS